MKKGDFESMKKDEFTNTDFIGCCILILIAFIIASLINQI